uniref:F-box domain-containing protein n=1 Tax=Pithovirus LCPAC406 TaxID=2506599 RepID=A0A481ZEX7_9VIRU|nr:MAG: uncharacterized protein LCPAC406_02290 [Pithovirus LCPAC406]
MPSISEILERIRLTRGDLNNLTPALVLEIFLELSIGDISILCRASKKFNDECLRESLWKTKVWADFGVDKKYGETWRETAKNMFIIGMINLGKQWFDGRTYKQVFEKALNEGEDGAKYLRDIQADAIMKTMDYDRGDAESFSFFPYEEFSEDIRAFFTDEEYKEADETIESMKIILSEEFSIIASVAVILSKSYPMIPGGPRLASNLGIHQNPSSTLTFIISKVIDPIPYIMQACAYVKDDKSEVIYKFYSQ